MIKFVSMDGSREVDIRGVAYPFKSDFERQQNVGEAESGRVRIYDRGLETEMIGIKLTGLTSDQSLGLEHFIRYVARYRLNPFKFQESDENIRIVRYWEGKYSRNMVNYGIYELDFTLRVEV